MKPSGGPVGTGHLLLAGSAGAVIVEILETSAKTGLAICTGGAAGVP